MISGEVAQLVECRENIAEVEGSIPSFPTPLIFFREDDHITVFNNIGQKSFIW